MKQDDPGESDLPLELAKASTPGADEGQAPGDENPSRSLHEAQIKHLHGVEPEATPAVSPRAREIWPLVG
jgi:hypothetical protein